MKTIPGFSSYAVDDDGNIWRQVWPANQAGRAPRAMASHRNGRYGYRTVKLVNDDGAQVHVTVHRIVALAHLGARPDGLQVRHIDGDNQNNHPSNLAYGTPQENIDDRGRHRGHASGERNAAAKLTANDVVLMRSTRDLMGTSYRRLGVLFGVSHATARKACLGLSWEASE